jgi:dTMP kinase
VAGRQKSGIKKRETKLIILIITGHNMRKKGLLIVFEGLDGSGKGTQLKLLEEYLEDENMQGKDSQIKMFREHLNNIFNKDRQIAMFSQFLEGVHRPFATYDFPRYYDNFWGKTVGRMLTGEFGKRVNPYLRSIFYMLDQADACKQIRRDLNQGKIVICNRYITSSYIFQTALIRKPDDKKKYLDWLEQAGFKELNMIRPDVVIALYVKPETAQELILKKNSRGYLKEAKDINEKNLKLQVNAAKEMLRMCRETKNWQLINCMDGNVLKSQQQIAKEIREFLKHYLT